MDKVQLKWSSGWDHWRVAINQSVRPWQLLLRSHVHAMAM